MLCLTDCNPGKTIALKAFTSQSSSVVDVFTKVTLETIVPYEYSAEILNTILAN